MAESEEDEQKSLLGFNKEFLTNQQLARSLQENLPHKDKAKVQIWLDKLLSMDKNIDQMSSRNNYMWFILAMLRAKRIRAPFTELPPSELPPLEQFVPSEVYEEVLLRKNRKN